MKVLLERRIPGLGAILLAAGHGTRMQSRRQKILHEVGGAPMVRHIFEAAAAVAAHPPVLVIAPGETAVPALFGDRAVYVTQAERLGTGHATQMAESALRGRAERVLVTYGDMPLLRAATLADLARRQAESDATITLLTVRGAADSSFGRVIVADGRVREIVEVAEARRRPNGDELLAVATHNVGVYCCDAEWLWANLPALPVRQARSGPEYYLTDLIGRAVDQGRLVTAVPVADPEEALGAGTRTELVAVERAFRRRANAHWLAHGVTLVDPATTYIDQSVTIGQDSVIWPNTYLQGETVIGRDCVVGPNAIVRDSRVGDGCVVEQVLLENEVLPAGERARSAPWRPAPATVAAIEESS